MTYALHYCEPLAVFRLTCETDGTSRPKTEAQLRAEFSGNATLLAWLDFAIVNPGKDCVYSMLP